MNSNDRKLEDVMCKRKASLVTPILVLSIIFNCYGQVNEDFEDNKSKLSETAASHNNDISLESTGTPVVFNDQNLKAAIEAGLGVTNPTESDMLELKNLNARKRNITSLTGLEYAKNMQTLDLSINQIEELSPLSGLANLKTLVLAANQVNTLSDFTGLTSIEKLNLYNWPAPVSCTSCYESISHIFSLS